MKNAPTPRPDWIRICRIEHEEGNAISFPVVDDLPTLLWIVNLGCIDLNPWYARCDDVDGPDVLHFDLDPVKGRPPRCRSRSSGRRRCWSATGWRRSGCRPFRRPRARGASTSTCRSCAGPDRSRCYEFAKAVRPRARGAPSERPDRGVCRRASSRAAACSSTTTRTAGAGRSPRCTPCGLTRGRPFRRRSRGTRSRAGSRSPTSTSGTCPTRVRELGDLFAPSWRLGGRVRLETHSEPTSPALSLAGRRVGGVHRLRLRRPVLPQEDRQHDDGEHRQELALPVLERLVPEAARRDVAARA